MSLIADALQAAQREKGGGASDVNRAAAASVLRTSPVRNEAYAGMPVGLAPAVRWAAIALGGALIVAATVLYLAPGDELPSQAGPEAARQLPDPATTGRVDPEELPFLANLSPGQTAAAPGDGGAAEPDVANPGLGDGGPVEQDGLPLDPRGFGSVGGGGLPDGASARPASAAPGQTASRATQPEGAPRQAPAGAVVPTAGSPPAVSPSSAATVIHGRFELSVANATIPLSDRLAEAVAAQQAGDFGGAIVIYEQILAQQPDHAEARNNLGIALHSRGDLAGAREAFRAALAVDPLNASAWSNLGAVLSRLGELGEAEAALGEASRLDPTNLGAKVNLANLLLARGLANDARLLLAEVLQRDPRHAEGNYAMGKTLDAQGDAPGAVRHYQAFLAYGAARFPTLDAPVRQRIQQLTPR